jgi:cytochrome c oxidase cbb3-type subunit I/II
MASGTTHKLHRALERRAGTFTILATLAILVGGIAEIGPLMMTQYEGPEADHVEPYTPLELAGRDIYVREGCYNCHSQMIRPMVAEVKRYGEWTRSWEIVHDRPFQLGSRRIGPDLAREGGIRTDAWHWDHFRDPRAMQPGSIMPSYAWLLRWRIDPADIQASVRAMQRLGVSYPADAVERTPALLQAQGEQIVANLAEVGIEAEWDLEVIALIAYMQRLGTDFQRVQQIMNPEEPQAQVEGTDGDSARLEVAP